MKSGGDKKRAPRLRLLSWEEIALWRHATADVKPRAKKAPTESKCESKVELPAPSAPKPPPAPFAKKVPSPPVAESARGLTKFPAAPTPPPPLAPLDRRLKRRLSSGRAEVDDVIDLHGMTQAQAHQALNAFLWRAARSGAKIVLVVTGKGKPRGLGGFDGESGVLRRHTPQWLRDSTLRPIVLSVEEAAPPHGGSGALYVRLRRHPAG